MRILTVLLAALLTATGAQAQDWSGPYAGLGFSQADGEQVTPFVFPMKGTPVSLFAGYNWQRGNLVFGGELAIHQNDIVLIEFPGIEYNDLVDLKARIGFAMGRTLVYGTVGRAQSRYELTNFRETLTGSSYGAGAEVQVSDRVFVGAEYLTRDLDFTSSANQNEVNTFTLRLGVSF